MIQFQENAHKEWKEGWKDGQTLYYRTLLATPRGATSTTAIDWHLQIKDTEYKVGLTH